MAYNARLVDTENFEIRELIFEGDDMPSEEILKRISSDLEDITYADYIVFSNYKYLPNGKGFSLKKLETASWSGIYVSLCLFFEKKFPGTKIYYS